MVLKRWLRGLNGFVSLLALALLLLVVAWLASNWNDAPPQPRPAALQLPSPVVPDDRNAYFALAGLHATAGREPSSAGQALWKLQLARATTTRPTSYAASVEQPDSAIEAVLGKSLPSIPGCDKVVADCVAQWIDQPDGLIEQSKAHALLGQRCERLLEGAFEFDEVLAPMRTVAEPMAQHGIGALNCSRWLLGGAVLSWMQQDPARAIALLNRADRLNRALLESSHSLIGQMIAIRTTRNTLDTASALAVRDSGLASTLTHLLAPLPDQTKSIKRWMAVEAAFGRGMITELAGLTSNHAAVAASAGEPSSDDFDLYQWLLRHRLGFHPERTVQANDAQWLRSIQELNGGLLAAISVRSSEAANNGLLNRPTWLNPVGNVLVSVGHPSYAGYLARHADLHLHHEAAALVIHATAANVPPAQRRAWLAQQPRSPLARERIDFADDGLVLSARTWQETSVPGVQPLARDTIRVTWPTPR
jgi:hypothetical protein